MGSAPTGAGDVAAKVALAAAGAVAFYFGGRRVLAGLKTSVNPSVSRQAISDLVLAGPNSASASKDIARILNDAVDLNECFYLLNVAHRALRFDILDIGIKSSNFVVKATALQHVLVIWLEKKETRALIVLRRFLAGPDLSDHPVLRETLAIIKDVVSGKQSNPLHK